MVCLMDFITKITRGYRMIKLNLFCDSSFYLYTSIHSKFTSLWSYNSL
ncbi:hypothetical protein BN173_3290006 [Clostridioides difficile T11]|nr:hypothetical protein BN173_3290006 [Clostridioides difficile T11]CCL39936.1 hypothetical protein BN176_3210002 [Clostridioides difficile E19]